MNPDNTVPIPIFIITRDRLAVLQKCIASLKQLSTPYQIIIHDNNSTYQPLIDFLKAGAESGEFKVFFNPRNRLEDVGATVSAFFKQSENEVEESKAENEVDCKPHKYYIVTDPDVELKDVQPDMLEFYKFLLGKYPNVKVVGPMLEIDDLPDCYPLKERVISSHTKQFWGKKGQEIEYKSDCGSETKPKKIKIQRSMIDTTFGMYRDSFRFKRLNSGIRTYAPYSARHLDWYIDPENMSDDQIYYLKTSCNHIGHWSSSYLKPCLEKKSE